MKRKNHYNQGSVLIITMMLFVAISLSVALGLVVPVLHANRTAQDTLESKRSYYIAESGVEDVLYRLREGKQLDASETLVLGTAETTTTVTNLSMNEKQITSLGDVNNKNRSVNITISQGAGVSFNYGVQIGQGGLVMTGSSGINGTIYSNGDIYGSSSSFITGSAYAANGEALSAEVQNGITGTPPASIIFGATTAAQDVAQSFIISTNTAINKAQFYIRKIGNPSNATVSLVTNSAGSPGTTVIASGTLSASLVTTSYGWVQVIFTSNPVLIPGATYWLVIDAGVSASSYYTLGANSGEYTSGSAKIGRYGTSWSATSPATLDGYFSFYVGGQTSRIYGNSQYNRLKIGTGGSGTAHAQTIDNVAATGLLYCQNGTGNNKSCNTGQSVPAASPWPVSDGNIQTWKDEALLGGTQTGNVNAGNGYQTATLGPKKIVGDLTVGGSATLNVTGTLWITGDLIVAGSGKLKLASAYGTSSGVIIVDGTVTIGGSAPVNGSGTSGSYILLVSLSDCPTSPSCGSDKAIEISGAAGAVVLVAQNGTVSFSGSAQAKQVTAYKLSLSGTTTVTYESGLADMSFSNSPSGTWNIDSWKEE